MRRITFAIFLLIILYGCGEEGKELPPSPVTTAQPKGGVYPSSYTLTVTLKADREAVIYYTLDGSTPEPGKGNTLKGKSPVEGIRITRDTVLKFFAVDKNGNVEKVKSEKYTIDLPPVLKADPPGGIYNSPQVVVISANEPCDIYYTIDGRTPTKEDYDGFGKDSVSIDVSSDLVLKFFAEDYAVLPDGREMPNKTEIRTEEYFIDTISPTLSINPEGGWYSGKISVSISASETATIYYTTDGFDPSDDPQDDVRAGGHTHTADTSTTVHIDDHTVLKAFAVDTAGNYSPFYTEIYRIGPAPMVFVSPLPGLYNVNPLIVEVSTEPATSYVSYTTDGTDPQFPNPPSCQAPCTVPITTEGITDLKVMASDGTHNDKVRTFRYEVDSIPPSTQADPAGGVFDKPISLSLTANEDGCTVFYTLDGSNPSPSNPSTVSAPSPVTGISIDKDTTVKFYSVDRAYNRETTKSVTFQIYGSFVEEFRDTQYMDPANTDAEWDTRWRDPNSGEIKGALHLPRGEPEEEGSITLAGGINDIEIYGNIAILSTNAQIVMVGIQDTSFPSILATYNASATEAPIGKIFVKGKELFASTSLGFIIFDLSGISSNPSFKKIGQYRRLQNPQNNERGKDVYAMNNALFLADGTQGIISYDISFPSSITEKDREPVVGGDSQAISVYGDYLYVAAGAQDIVIIDIKYPFNMTQSGAISTISGDPVSIKRFGKFLLVGTTLGELHIFDLSNPVSPSLLKTIALSSDSITDMEVDGDYLYVANRTGGLYVYRFENPESPELLKRITNLGTVISLRLYGKRLLVGTSEGNLRILRMANPIVPLEEASLSNSFYKISSEFPFISAVKSDGISILSYSNGKINEVSQISLSDVRDSAFIPNLLYIVRKNSLDLYDISDISSPSQITSVSLSDGRGIDVEGDILAVADGSDGLKLFDISNVTQPVYISSFHLPAPYSGIAQAVELKRNIAFVSFGTSGIWLININDPYSPSEIGRYDTPGSTYHSKFDGDFIFLADGNNGFVILKAQNLQAPSLLSSLQTTLARSLSLYGTDLFLTDGSGGLKAIDITFLESPVIVRAVSSPDANFVLNIGHRLIYSDSTNGLKVLRAFRSSLSYQTPKKAQSLDVVKSDINIVKAKIETNPSVQEHGSISFQLSNDGGRTWEDVKLGEDHIFNSKGKNLRWRAILSTNDPDFTPYIDSLKIIYRYAQ